MNGEVLIIGGGVIGLALARELRKRTRAKITVVERGAIGGEASAAAAGMLAPRAEADKFDDFYYFCEQSSRLYPNFAAELLDETGVDIELERQGTLYLALTETDVAEIRRRFAWQKKNNLPVEHLTARETTQIEPFVSPDVLESLFFPNDWQVENRHLLAALRKFAESNGIELRENTKIENLIIENNRVVGAQSETEKFFAGQTIIATGAWTSAIKADGFQMPPVKPIRGQIAEFQTAKRLFGKVIYSPRGYLVPRRDGRILIGATVEDAGFDKSVTAEADEFLRRGAIEIAPSLINLKISESRAGLRPFAPDGLPILGAIFGIENLQIATAHYRNGILLAPLTAKILAEKLTANVESKFLELFSPQRFAGGGKQKISSVVGK